MGLSTRTWPGPHSALDVPVGSLSELQSFLSILAFPKGRLFPLVPSGSSQRLRFVPSCSLLLAEVFLLSSPFASQQDLFTLENACFWLLVPQGTRWSRLLGYVEII